MNKEVNVYSFNDECYVYLGDYKKLQNNWNELKKFVEDSIKQHGCGTTMYLTSLLKKMQEIGARER